MEYTHKKANRMLEVERGDLDHERTQIESHLSRNVRKTGSTLKRMEGMREENKKLASDVRAVTKRLTFEKDCVEHRLRFEKEVHISFTFLPHLYMIPFFLHCIKALQRKAQKYNAEKKESNITRRKVDELLRTMEGRQKRLQNAVHEAQEVILSQQRRVISVRCER
jgi:hypothetical protein